MPDRRDVLALGASSLLTGARVNADAQVRSRLFTSRLQTRLGPIDFQTYLPAGYDDAASNRYPLVMLLHGRGDSMAAWTRLRPALDAMIQRSDVPPMIAVLPDAPWSRRGNYYVDSAHAEGSPVETLLLDELLPHVDARWRIRSGRDARLIGGYSMGGYGALRLALARPDAWGAAIALSPAVYTPLPPAGSSAREFGAFGSDRTLFVDTIYESKNYPALLPALRKSRTALRVFIAAGDNEYKHPDPADAPHDIDFEAHQLFSRLSREPNCATALRILQGGHDWSVWQPAFFEGLRWCARELAW